MGHISPNAANRNGSLWVERNAKDPRLPVGGQLDRFRVTPLVCVRFGRPGPAFARPAVLLERTLLAPAHGGASLTCSGVCGRIIGRSLDR